MVQLGWPRTAYETEVSTSDDGERAPRWGANQKKKRPMWVDEVGVNTYGPEGI